MKKTWIHLPSHTLACYHYHDHWSILGFDSRRHAPIESKAHNVNFNTNPNTVEGLEWAKVAELEIGKTYQIYIQFVNREQKKTKKGDPFYSCTFRDQTGKVESMAWNNSELYRWCEDWKPGEALWIVGGLTQKDPKYKANLEISEFLIVTDHLEKFKDFEWSMLIESAKWEPDTLRGKIFEILRKTVTDHRLIQLVEFMFDDHWDVLATLPAASRMHHAVQSGWLEHIWSMTRLASMIGSHYSKYYNDLDPPLQTDILIVGAILHDIGKALELSNTARTEATYTHVGKLLGHIVMGRDMIREVAARLDPPLDEERLLRLEHAVLSHHGRMDYGSPVVPQTLESLLLSQIDDMDAKVNAVTRALKQAQMSESEESSNRVIWTEKVTACDPYRAFYRGQPLSMIPEKVESLVEQELNQAEV